LAFFEHVKTAPHLYWALASGPEAGSGPSLLRDCFEARVRQVLDSRGDSAATGPELAIQQAIFTRVVASSLLAVIECWVEAT
jgi:hypothetical protein